MQRLRPVHERDLPQLAALVRSVQGGLTTLPPDEAFLQERIDDSLRAFSSRVRKPGGEYYLFVLENSATGELMGTSAIAARVGGFDPFYSYERRQECHQHAPLGISRMIEILHLKREHKGPTELCSLFLREQSRRAGMGRLLSLGRFLFMAAQPERFTSTVIAELRGFATADGRSPFWECVGRHFFEEDFYTADVRSGLGHKQFIADLMPAHPIYVPLLAPEVRSVIGRVHPDTEPALALLKAEGFEATQEIDIFDAGPQIRAEISTIRTVRQQRRGPVRGPATPEPGASLQLIATTGIEFRACIGRPTFTDDGGIHLDPEVIQTLECKPGELLVCSPLR